MQYCVWLVVGDANDTSIHTGDLTAIAEFSSSEVLLLVELPKGGMQIGESVRIYLYIFSSNFIVYIFL